MYMLKPYMQGKNYTYQLHLKKESEAHHRRLRNSTSQIKRLGLNKEPQRVSTANWNPKRRMQEDERFHEVEAENARLLQRMTRILEKPKKPDHFLNLFDARAYARAQEHKALLKENKLIWKRISETPSYYHAEEWDNERKKTEHVLRHMGLYPYTPPKQGKRKQKDNKKQEERDAAFLDTYWQRTMAAFSDAHPEIVAAAEAAQPTAQGGRASLPSLDRPSDDEWMLPGLGRPPRYSGFGSPPSTASTYSMRSRSASSHKPLRNSTPDAVVRPEDTFHTDTP